MREAPGGDAQPPIADRHIMHPNTVWKGQEGKARNIETGPQSSERHPSPRPKEAQKRDRHTAVHSREERAQTPRERREGGNRPGPHSSSRDAGHTTQARPPQTGAGRARGGGKRGKGSDTTQSSTCQQAQGGREKGRE